MVFLVTTRTSVEDHTDEKWAQQTPSAYTVVHHHRDHCHQHHRHPVHRLNPCYHHHYCTAINNIWQIFSVDNEILGVILHWHISVLFFSKRPNGGKLELYRVLNSFSPVILRFQFNLVHFVGFYDSKSSGDNSNITTTTTITPLAATSDFITIISCSSNFDQHELQFTGELVVAHISSLVVRSSQAKNTAEDYKNFRFFSPLDSLCDWH